MITDLAVILPCDSLDDFPTHFRRDDAEGLLAAWTALWHPALLSAINKAPNWYPASEPPASPKDHLLILPEVSQSYLPHGFLDEARGQGAVVVEDQIHRGEIVAKARAALSGQNSPAAKLQGHEESLADDFFALGFCRLQGELLARRMRYSRHLDECRFEQAIIAAANAWTANDPEEVRAQLKSAFGALSDARAEYYPVDAYFIDVILVAPTTIGPALRRELSTQEPQNLLLSAAVLEQVAQREPESLAAIWAGLEAGRLGLIGGDFDSAQLPLMTHEAILAELQSAGRIYEKRLGRRPTVFGRRTFGLTPVLPQILHQTGFTSAWHVALDGGLLPKTDRSKIRWEAVDGTSIDALASLPLDAGVAETFLKLPEQLGTTMDNDFVATLMFARWPGYASDFHRDLQRTAEYGAVLGRFITIEDYFRETAESSIRSKFSPDEYRTPYLSQTAVDGVTDPISQHRSALQSSLNTEIESALSTMTAALRGPATDADPIDLKRTYAAALPRKAQAPEQGMLVVNPLNFTRSVGIELPNGFSVRSSETSRAVVDVPPQGFAWIASAENFAVAGAKKTGPIAHGNVLRNEFCEVTVSQSGGGIQSIYDLRTHGNRLSQQIAFRLSRADSGGERSVESDDGLYTTMLAEGIEIATSDEAFGKIVSRGRLVDPLGHPVARFTQSTSLWCGSRVIDLQLTISEVADRFDANSWTSYLACRFAWPMADVELRRSVHGCSFTTEANRIEAPEFVEISAGRQRTAILTGGLPFHRRVGSRMLDSLLLVRGETARSFHLGIGIDVPYPWRAAKEILLPPMIFAEQAPPPVSGTAGWLFHIDAPNVTTTHWSPLVDAGRVVGFRVRLLEVEGRSSRVHVRSFRQPLSAIQTSVVGEPLSTLHIDGDAIHFEMGGYDWTQIETRW